MVIQTEHFYPIWIINKPLKMPLKKRKGNFRLLLHLILKILFKDPSKIIIFFLCNKLIFPGYDYQLISHQH